MELADGGNEIVWILDHATGQILSGFGQPGHQPGNFSYVHTISIDSKGNLIAGETINGRRVQRFKLSGYQPAGTMLRSGVKAAPLRGPQAPSLKTDTSSFEFAKESESYVQQLYYRA
jgi:hypothetical protein